MTNIEIPAEIKANAQRILDGRQFYMDSTVEMAEFILGLYKPEIEVENFVVYKVRCADKIYAGFRFSADLCWKKWILVEIEGEHGADQAVPQFNTAILTEDYEIEVLERWTPEAPQPVFGIGDTGDDVDKDREVLVKGVLCSEHVDSDGDVLVQLPFSQDLTESHYVSAGIIAYAEESK